MVLCYFVLLTMLQVAQIVLNQNTHTLHSFILQIVIRVLIDISKTYQVLNIQISSINKKDFRLFDIFWKTSSLLVVSGCFPIPHPDLPEFVARIEDDSGCCAQIQQLQNQTHVEYNRHKKLVPRPMGARWKRRAAAADPTPAGNKIRISRNSTRADCFHWLPESANPTNFSYCHCPGWRRVGVGQHSEILQKIPKYKYCLQEGMHTFVNLISWKMVHVFKNCYSPLI